MEDKRVIEINGIKLEVDLRTAKRVDQFKVGDTVKVLTKKYGDTFESHLGVIAGFDAFKERPTIIVAYLSTGYNESTLQFLYINQDSKDVEICAAQDFDLTYEKSDIVSRFDSQIEKKNEEIRELEAKRKYFMNQFGKYFEGKSNDHTPR